MILTSKQNKRFHKLFGALTTFAVNERGVGSEIVDENGRQRDGARVRMCDLIWGDEGDLTLIDRFVDLNPSHLGRTDLREVLSWKGGITAEFWAARAGNDTVFVAAGNAFVVRGLERELDAFVGDFPCHILTTLVPFDGLITFVTYTKSRPLEDGENPDDISPMIVEARSARRLARTARDFTRIAPEAVRDIERARRGSLAGLAWDQRMNAIQARRSKIDPPSHRAALATLDEWAHATTPVHSLEEACQLEDRPFLVRYATDLGIVDDPKRLEGVGIGEISRRISRTPLLNRARLLNEAVAAGEHVVTALKRAVAFGGTLTMAAGDVRNNPMPLCPLFPVTLLFHVDDQYLLVAPSEVLERLEGVDWTNEMNRAKVATLIANRFETLIAYRGAVEERQAVMEVASSFKADGDITPHVTMTLARRLFRKDIGLHQVLLSDEGDDDETTTYLVAPELLATCGEDDMLRSLLASVRDVEHRPLDGQPFAAHLAGLPSYRALIAYLDAHVPEDEDPFGFADEMAARIVRAASQHPTLEAARTVADARLPASDEVDALLNDLIEDIPRWERGGYSARELAQLAQEQQEEEATEEDDGGLAEFMDSISHWK